MANSIARTSVYLSADARDFAMGIGKAQEQFKGFTSYSVANLKAFEAQHVSTFQKIGNVAKIGIGVGMGVAAGAVYKAIGELKEFNAESVAQSKSARALSVPVEEFSAMNFALGRETEKTEELVGELQKKIGAALTGDEGASGAFKKLGLSATFLQNSSLPDQIYAIADGMAKLDRFARAETAEKIFGEKAKSAMPFLNRGSQYLRERVDQGRLGGLITNESASKLAEEQAKRDMELSLRFEEAERKFANKVNPFYQKVKAGLADGANEVLNWAERNETLSALLSMPVRLIDASEKAEKNGEKKVALFDKDSPLQKTLAYLREFESQQNRPFGGDLKFESALTTVRDLNSETAKLIDKFNTDTRQLGLSDVDAKVLSIKDKMASIENSVDFAGLLTKTRVTRDDHGNVTREKIPVLNEEYELYRKQLDALQKQRDIYVAKKKLVEEIARGEALVNIETPGQKMMADFAAMEAARKAGKGSDSGMMYQLGGMAEQFIAKARERIKYASADVFGSQGAAQAVLQSQFRTEVNPDQAIKQGIREQQDNIKRTKEIGEKMLKVLETIRDSGNPIL
jgi:hypothetical protein